MAANKLLGVDIGNDRIKFAVTENGTLKYGFSVKHPENMVRGHSVVSWDAMAEFIKDALRENKVKCKNAALVLPTESVYIRRTTLPLMNVNQLAVNLPYEFHEYTQSEPDKYMYDYAVLSKNEDTMDLIAVAGNKEMLSSYVKMFEKAGLRLKVISPDVMAFYNIICEYEKRNDIEHGSLDYAVLDMGDSSLKIHFFNKGDYDITKNMDNGCREIYLKAADDSGKDEHIAKLSFEAGNDDLDREISESADEVIGSMALQIMRVLNFYSFNNPGNNIDTLYYCGGGSNIKELINSIEDAISIKLAPFTDIMGEQVFGHEMDILGSPQAYGAAIQ